jgi:hypothetical protein
MSSLALSASHRSKILLATGLFVAAGLLGCNKGPSADPAAIDNVAATGPETGGGKFDTNREFHMLPVAKLAGRVTIDGQPPKKDCRLFLILTDPQHLDENAHGMLPKYFAACDADGNFGFNTYSKHDGVFPGKYVLTFVELHVHKPSASSGGRNVKSLPASKSVTVGYGQPDELKNLYSDPDSNFKDQRFNLYLKPPGKDDYRFDLVVAGKQPIAKPAPHAVQKMSPKQLSWPPENASAGG